MRMNMIEEKDSGGGSNKGKVNERNTSNDLNSTQDEIQLRNVNYKANQLYDLIEGYTDS